MTTRVRPAFPLIAALVAAAVLVVIIRGGDSPYRIKMVLANASGLHDGSDVAIGGVRVGRVRLDFDGADRVVATLEIDRTHAPINKDVRAAISAVNLLGAKRVDLIAGPAAADPAPDGYEMPTRRVEESTDLDQVLDVLDPDTRTRLAVLLSEAGTGVAGRRADLNSILTTLPPSLKDATHVVNELVQDNDTLASLLTRSDGFVNELTRNRGKLERLIAVGGGATETLASRDPQLKATLASAPPALRTLQRFLGELEETTVPLGPAAREIATAAPELSKLVDEIEPFRRAANPTLDTATDLAPDLTKLATGATPVLRRAVPTVASLNNTGTSLAPVSKILDKSADNLIGILDNWSRAIQFRDAASHVFRGQPSVTPNTLDSVLSRLEAKNAAAKAKRKKTSDSTSPETATDAASGPPASRPAVPGAPKLPDIRRPLKGIGKAVDDTLSALGVNPPADPSTGKSGAASSLLDFLLGP